MSSRSAISPWRPRLLRREFPDVRFSPWYRNRAVGFEGADFINLSPAFTTSLPMNEMLARLQPSRSLCGRPRDAPRWAPRSMDLDVLLYGDLVCDEPKLKLPRPDLLKRAFMLGPLADLAPELMHPTERRRSASCGRVLIVAAHQLVEVEPHYQPTLRPPSTARICPVTYGASAAKNSAARATSSAVPGSLQRGAVDDLRLQCFVDAILRPHHRSGRDGVHSYMRVPSSRARDFVSMMSPAFAMLYTGWRRSGRMPWMSTRLSMSPCVRVQRRSGGLRQKQRRLEVGSDEIVPVELA